MHRIVIEVLNSSQLDNVVHSTSNLFSKCMKQFEVLQMSCLETSVR